MNVPFVFPEARQALDAAVRYWCNAQRADQAETAWRHADRAVRAGCNDGLVKYLAIRLCPANLLKGVPPAEQIARSEEAADLLASSRYPAFRRAIAQTRAAGTELSVEAPPPPERVAAATRRLDAALALPPEVLADKGPYARKDACDLCADLITGYRALTRDRKVGFDKVMPALEKDPDARALRLLVRGIFFIDYAWDARGDGPASTVTEEGWKGMQERLGEAAQALAAAWAVAPDRPTPLNALSAAKMIAVEMGRGGDRDTMETWFKRAMLADGDNVLACQVKMNYLEPKWLGSREDVLAFGRQCLETGNWEGNLPLLLVNAHLRLSHYLPEDKRPEYFKDPAVWDDFKAVFEPYLERFPDDFHTRTAYLQAALRAGDLAVARRQVKLLGDNYSRLLYTEQEYEQARAQAGPGGSEPGSPPERK